MPLFGCARKGCMAWISNNSLHQSVFFLYFWPSWAHSSHPWATSFILVNVDGAARSCEPWWILSPSLNITPQQKYNWSSDPHMDFRLQSLRILENWKPLIILYSVALLKYLKCKQIIPPIPILSKHTLLARTCYNFLLQLSGWHWSKDCSSAQQEPSLIYIKSKYWVVLVGDIFFSLVCTVFHHKM